eukprot:3638348-Pleurochrysis_carterae.AAC.1
MHSCAAKREQQQMRRHKKPTAAPKCVHGIPSSADLRSIVMAIKPDGSTSDLTVAPEGEGVVPLPGGAPRRAQLAGAIVASAQAAARASGGREAAQLAVLVHGVAQPVDARVLANHLVVRIDHDALIVLV